MSTPERSLDARFSASSKSWKLRVHSWQSELAKLPPRGERWKWSVVVGDDDGSVDRRAAHAVKLALDRHETAGGVEHEVSEELESYLADRHGVDLTGEALVSDAQQTLPVTSTGGEGGARGARGDSGREASDDTQHVQRTLTGDERRVTNGERGGRSERGDEWVVAGWTATATERAAQHPDQAVLNQFNTSPGVVDKFVSPGGWVVDPSPGVGVGVTS